MIEIDLPANKLPLDTIKERVATVFKDYDVDKAYIYGSYVNGGFDFSSDYDLLVDGFKSEKDVDPFTGHSRKIKEMQLEIEKALDREVDIVLMSIFDQPDHTDQQREFRKNVEKEKVHIYGK